MGHQYRADIDGLRAVSIFLVVVYHAFPTLIPGGFIGVDVFFVISGYLITSHIQSDIAQGSFSFKKFYARRARRLFPALGIVIIATLVIGALVLYPSALKTLARHALAGAAFIPNFVYWSEAGYFDVAAETKPLLHLWPLGIEEQFYLVWPLILLLMLKSRRPAAAISALALLSFAYSVYLTSADPVAAFYSPLTRFWELSVGGLLTFLPPPDKEQPAVGGIGLALIVASGVVLDSESPFPGASALAPVLGSAMVIRHPAPMLAVRPLVFTGLISYGIYLWHWPLLTFLAIRDMATIEARILAIVLAALLAWMTMRFVETPLRYRMSVQRGVAASAGILVIACSAAAAAHWQHYITGSPPADVQHVLSLADYEPGQGARYPECWVKLDAPADAHAEECFAGSILIWGDSHAARLYTGFGAPAAVAQTTRDSCAAVTLDDSPCGTANRAVLDQVIGRQYPVVVLYGVWTDYFQSLGEDSVKSTIKYIASTLKNNGTKTVVLLGPPPYWQSLPEQVFAEWKRTGDLPERISPRNLPYEKIDDVFREIASETGAEFFSVYDLLCNGGSCLTHVPPDRSALVTWDYGHFTAEGATYVVRAISRELAVLRQEPRS